MGGKPNRDIAGGCVDCKVMFHWFGKPNLEDACCPQCAGSLVARRYLPPPFKIEQRRPGDIGAENAAAKASKSVAVRARVVEDPSFAGEMPNTRNGWTLVDPGPFRLLGRRGYQVKIQCKCGHVAYVERGRWVTDHMSNGCSDCFRTSGKMSKGNGAYSPIPSPVLPDPKNRSR